MASSIDKLAEELWDACVIQRAAENQETVNRWQADELSHLKERFSIRPIPPEMNELVQSALMEWQQIETNVCSHLGKNREDFLNEFQKTREDFLNGGEEWQTTINYMQNKIYGAVRNMDWVNLFSWILPGADKDHSEEYRKIGRMVTAILYIEVLYDYGHNHESGYLKKIEGRWRLVNQL